jgi:hypothetical protein
MAFRLKCLLHMCGGNVISEWNDDGVLWMAWQCASCGAIKHAEPAYPEVRRPPHRSVGGGGRRWEG